VRGTTTIGIVSGFAALFTSTLGGSALACTHRSADGGVAVSADAARSFDDVRLGLERAHAGARLATFAKFEHAALAALSATASDVGSDISTAAGKDASAKLLDHAGSARANAVTDLADAKAALAGAGSALAEGQHAAAARLLRTAGTQLRAAAGHLGVARMLVGAAIHAAFEAAKATRLADAKPRLATPAVNTSGADPTDFGHHCDGSGDRHWGDSQWGGRDRYRSDADHHDRYHHAWRH
jgi:hypothetical protein